LTTFNAKLRTHSISSGSLQQSLSFCLTRSSILREHRFSRSRNSADS